MANKPYIRPDFLIDKKNVHCALPKTTFVEFQKKLLDLGITMTMALGEFAKLVAVGDKRAIRLLEDIAQQVFRAELNKYHQTKNDPIDKLDQDVLYHLIEKDLNEKNIDTDDD